MINFKEIDKKHLTVIGLGLIAFLALTVALVILTINHNKSYEEADGAGAGEETNAYTLTIKNRYQLSQTYGTRGAAAIIGQLEKITSKESELAAATKTATSADGYKNHYAATLIESSFSLYTREPEIYTFTLEISDGRTYQVYARPCFDVNVEPCYGVVAVRDGIVNFDSPAVDPDAVATLEAWKNQF